MKYIVLKLLTGSDRYGDLCNRYKLNRNMEVITIDSAAFRRLEGDLHKIMAFIEEQQKRQRDPSGSTSVVLRRTHVRQ